MSLRSVLRRVLAALSVVLLVIGASACSSGDQSRATIVVTTNILGDVVDNLVGDEVEVITLMQPNADPHSFGISAQQAAAMQKADLIVTNGLGLEEGLQRHVDAAVAAGVPQFAAGDHIEAIHYSAEEADGAPDPHLWTDPRRMIDVIDALKPVLLAIDGIDTDRTTALIAGYRTEIEQLDTWMAGQFAGIGRDRRKLVTNHHVFGYLAQRFDFTVIGAVLPGGTTLAAPSAADLRELADAIKRAGVPVIFAESSQPDRLIEVLASEAGVHVAIVELYSESLTAPGGGAETYLQMMRANTERIATGLSR